MKVLEESQMRILLRIPEAAAALSLGRSTIYKMMESGEIPTVRVGRAVRIPLTALVAWAERQIPMEEVGSHD